MRIIPPNVEWWPQDTTSKHIARVGRICYKSQGKRPPKETYDETAIKEWETRRDQDLCKSFWKSGHRSMYRHGTAYFYVPDDRRLPNQLWALLTTSPYIDYVAQGNKVWISTNMQFLCEHGNIRKLIDVFFVEEDEFIRRAVKAKCDEALYLLRMTFVVTTQISTSREFNRASPNCIAEQSTRYCNLEKKGGVMVVEPYWLHSDGTRWQRWLFKASCRISEWFYHHLLKSGMKPQNARGVLPLDTYTVVAYTYSIAEWSHIIDLRYHGTTGKPHPNAEKIGGMIHDQITERMKQYISDFKI
jgi:thymidylate synthase (FAD)